MSVAYAEVLLDAHVHFHAGFSRQVFFDAAWRNLSAGKRQLRLTGTVAEGPAVREPRELTESVANGLMLTESNGVNVFAGLAAVAESKLADSGNSETAEWGFRPTEEDNSLWAVRPSDDARILLVAGRQLVTREGLEVLALGCGTTLPDGMQLREARDSVIDHGGVPVVPWGFGKWWFSRGRLLAELLEADSSARWFLGDNAGRPQLSRPPALFTRAAERGVFVLPGSDPLPLAGQDAKPGRCGFHLPIELPTMRPAAAVMAALRSADRQPVTFGRYEGLAGFARNQVAMQLRKRRATADGIEART